MTLKLDDKGSCKIHSEKRGEASVSDGDGRDPPEHKEIVTNKTYVVMPWKMVTRNGKNITLAEAVEEIEAQRRKIEEERMLVSEFEAEHSYEIDRIFELHEHLYIDDIRAMFPEIYEFGPERLGIHLKSEFVIEGYSSDYQINQGDNRHCFKQIVEAYEGRDRGADIYVKKVKALTDNHWTRSS